jgi:hypothetical protein
MLKSFVPDTNIALALLLFADSTGAHFFKTDADTARP